MIYRLSLIKRFLILASISIASIWFIVSFITSYQIEQYTIKKIEDDTVSSLKDSIERKIPEEAFLNVESLKKQDLFSPFVEDTRHLNLSRIKIINSSGTVLYSDEKDLIGKSLSSESRKTFNKVLEGETEVEFFKIAPENGHEAEKALGSYLEIYIPAKYADTTKPVGAVEVYIGLKPLYESFSPFLNKIWGTLAIVFVALFYLLYRIFRNASDEIVEKNRELADRTTELKLSKDSDEALLKSIDEGLLMMNKDGQVLLLNPKAEKIIGISEADTSFRHYKGVLDLRDKDDKKIPTDFVKESLKNGTLTRKSSRDNVFIKSKGGKNIPISLVSVPIYDHKRERIIGSVLTLNDATTEKELDRVKDEFVYVIAHELNNPIFAINGYLSMILDGTFGKTTPKITDAIRSAEGSSQQLQSLVTDLLESIRSETGQMKFDLEKTDILGVTREIVKNLAIKARDKNTKVVIEGDKIPEVMSNYLKLKEIIMNLVDNAIKYSPKDSRVIVSFEKEGNQVITRVKDNGFGMSKKEAENLFTKFYRIQNDKTKGIPGTGLGLFIVKQLVEKMDGEIHAESEEGKGTTFIFTLKVAK